MAERVFMVHPELPGARISCAASGVGARQQSGWVLDDEQGGQATTVPETTPAYVYRLIDALFLAGGVSEVVVEGEWFPPDVLARLGVVVPEDHDEEAAPAAHADTEEQEE